MKQYRTRIPSLIGLAIMLAALCLVPACGQSSSSQNSDQATSAESQAADPSKTSKAKDTKSILDVFGGAVEGAKEAAEGAAGAVADAANNAAQGFSEWQKEQEEAAKARARERLEKAELTPKSKKLEYAKKASDPDDLVECSDTGVKVASEDKVDRSTVGSVKETYTLSYGGQTDERKVKFKVQDTKAPQIDFVSKEPKVDYGADYDPAKNINFVKDPVDGKLPQVDVPPEPQGSKAGLEKFYDSGWYTIDGSVDTWAQGTYPVTVTASDIHGNTSTRTFTVTVKEPEEEQAAVYDYTVYVTNTGSKYHTDGCRYLKSKRAISLSEAKAQGYTACSACGASRL